MGEGVLIGNAVIEIFKKSAKQPGFLMCDEKDAHHEFT